jgi:HD superfamily phosphohydrolase
MDRLDYLRRDSFYTGVTEGNIGSARIIKMLNVKDDHLVVDSKGIYSIENYLMARRLMYWQVYLHKTSVAAEKMLVSALTRAKELANKGVELFASPALHFFLYNNINAEVFRNNDKCLENYIKLDDNDIWTSLKIWCDHPDTILSTLSQGIINRKLFKVKVTENNITKERKSEIIQSISNQLNITKKDAEYFFFVNTIGKDMYSKEDDSIEIMYKDGETRDIAYASDMLNISTLSKKIRKYYICSLRI